VLTLNELSALATGLHGASGSADGPINQQPWIERSRIKHFKSCQRVRTPTLTAPRRLPHRCGRVAQTELGARPLDGTDRPAPGSTRVIAAAGDGADLECWVE